MQTNFSQFTCKEFTEVLASNAPVPGGGGACALVGAVGMALGNMVGSLTLNSKKYADVHDEMTLLCEEATALQNELLALMEADAKAFIPLSQAYKLPKDTPEEKAHKAEVMAACLDSCCQVPLKIMECCAKAIELQEIYAEKGSAMALSDAGVGAILCLSAMQGAALNVRINTKSMADKNQAQRYNQKVADLLATYTPKANALYEKVNAAFD